MSDPAAEPQADPATQASINAKAFSISREGSTTADAIRHLDPERESRDRSWIGRQIVWIFTGVVTVALVIYLLQGLESGQWSAVATEVSELVRSTVLPVVTLILGYYFGRSGRA